MKQKYEFRSTANQVCCSMDDPEDLCPDCAARAAALDAALDATADADLAAAQWQVSPSEARLKATAEALRASHGARGAAGKRHSAKDQQMIQTVHNHSVDLGADCPPENGLVDGTVNRMAIGPTRMATMSATRSAPTSSAKPVLRTAEGWTRHFADSILGEAVVAAALHEPKALPAPDGYALAVEGLRTAKADATLLQVPSTKPVQPGGEADLPETYQPYGEPLNSYELALRRSR